MVRLDEVTDLMDQMMKLDIFTPSEKLRMLRNNDGAMLDPNLIMDERHKIFREDLRTASPTKCFVLNEARRLFTEEEAQKVHMKKEQEFLENELKKFEKELQRCRPKFRGPYACSKKYFANADDDDFWSTSKKIKGKLVLERVAKAVNDAEETIVGVNRNESERALIRDPPLKSDSRRNSLTIIEAPRISSIKVTIKDKSHIESQDQRLHVLRKHFVALRRNAKEERRLRDIKTRIQQNAVSKLTRKYFDIWRAYWENARKTKQARKEERESSDERKIERFISAITERQKELMKDRRRKLRETNPIVGNPECAEITKKNIYSKHTIIESPAQSRLNAQKRIIEKQRERLAEQNRIIEELRLKQAQEEISKSSRETMNTAKDTLAHCGQRTRRTLIQLMRQAGHREKCVTVTERPANPPRFLLRMEARAEARKERMRLLEEERRIKFEEQRRKEEAAKIEEEQEKRRLQQEALREARRLRREQEQCRLREIEKFKRLNEAADAFYRKYLLRRYLMEPLIALVEMKNKSIVRADEHYKASLVRKVFVAWRTETDERCRSKIELATSFYNGILMSRMFKYWRGVTKEVSIKRQVAEDFHDMKLLDKYFKSWRIQTSKSKIQYEKKAKLGISHYDGKLKSRYFERWKRFPEVAALIKESGKRKDELRQIVQKVIPDFDPKERGVAIED